MVSHCHECEKEWSVAVTVVNRGGHCYECQEWSVAVMIVMRGGQSLL